MKRADNPVKGISKLCKFYVKQKYYGYYLYRFNNMRVHTTGDVFNITMKITPKFPRNVHVIMVFFNFH